MTLFLGKAVLYYTGTTQDAGAHPNQGAQAAPRASVSRQWSILGTLRARVLIRV